MDAREDRTETGRQPTDKFAWYKVWVPVIITGIAAVGSWYSAFGSNRSADAARAAVALQNTPVLINSCEPRLNHRGSLPSTVLSLGKQRTQSVRRSEVPRYSPKGIKFTEPFFYIACKISNFGKLPAINVVYDVKFRIGEDATREVGEVSADVIPADRSFEYAIIKETDAPITLEYPSDVVFTDIVTKHSNHYEIWNPHRLDYGGVNLMPASLAWAKAHRHRH